MLSAGENTGISGCNTRKISVRRYRRAKLICQTIEYLGNGTQALMNQVVTTVIVNDLFLSVSKLIRIKQLIISWISIGCHRDDPCMLAILVFQMEEYVHRSLHSHFHMYILFVV